MKNSKIRRAVELVGTDPVLEVSKVVEVKMNFNSIHFDELPDGTWCIIYNDKLIPDFSKIQSFKIIRED